MSKFSKVWLREHFSDSTCRSLIIYSCFWIILVLVMSLKKFLSCQFSLVKPSSYPVRWLNHSLLYFDQHVLIFHFISDIILGNYFKVSRGCLFWRAWNSWGGCCLFLSLPSSNQAFSQSVAKRGNDLHVTRNNKKQPIIGESCQHLMQRVSIYRWREDAATFSVLS